ncbi:tautomerase family protein [Flexithrix dorotheae]|uniref:tautomerase family protein n=1 Tax=Flexithrix dorotheae TaxID=70993 RepID=UPI0003679F14|nr:4-oxalocrotonate tautomerase family protein [Flexithrix dorotheae]
MPYINIKVTDENVTRDQKKKLIEGVTDLMVEVLQKNPATTHVVIDEVPVDNWGVNSKMYSEKFKKS